MTDGRKRKEKKSQANTRHTSFRQKPKEDI